VAPPAALGPPTGGGGCQRQRQQRQQQQQQQQQRQQQQQQQQRHASSHGAPEKGALRTVARCYPDVAAMQPKEYWNDVCPIEWGAMEKYEVLQQLGKGKYGEVFEGIDCDDNSRCVVKIMRPVKEQRLKREIKILRHVRGGPNIVDMRDLVRDPDTKTPCFVFELVEAVPLRELQVGR
ncbi:hypothetical protein MNEG_14489, partial [Monoraphidium neglectum]